jgi:dienelactone hydrolase
MKKIITSFFLLSYILSFSQQNDTIQEFKIINQFTKYLINGKGNLAYTLIDTTVNKKYTGTYLQHIWQNFIKENGDFKKIARTWSYSSINHFVFYQDLKLKNGILTLKLSFTNKKLTGVYFLPSIKGNYKAPFYDKKNYTEEEVLLYCSDKIKLPATLTLPKNISKPPVVILVHGSGPSDRDEKIYVNKPFKDISIGLASLGIATLRYEKRTMEFMDELSANTDSVTIYNETINDAISATDFLSQRNDIDSKKIFIIGHSLGAMCAPKIAEQSNLIKGIILMAANFRPLEDLIIDQLQTILKVDSTNFQLKMALNTIKYQVSVLHSDTFSANTKKIFLPMNIPAKYWLSLKQYNQVAIASNLNKPILFLQGERDYQVTMSDFDLWQSKCSNNNSKFISYKKLNHLFMEGKGISKPSEYEKPTHVAFYVIEDIAKWIFSVK